MSEQTPLPGTTPVIQRRTAPRGVLPRGIQTWLMVGLAVGMLLIILLTGQPAPRTTASPAPAAQTPNPDRLREYQERLRQLDAYAARETQDAGLTDPSLPPAFGNDAGAPQDPLAAERARRDYESLFARVVVRDGTKSSPPEARTPAAQPLNESADAGAPSVDAIADAVVRATTRAQASAPESPPATAEPSRIDGASDRQHTPARTDPILAIGPRHLLLEGTVVDGVLTNRLDGSSAAPVNVLVTTPVYSHGGDHVLIPAGARVLGETRPVQAFGETRLAVAFHRLLMPDGGTYRLDQFRGLNPRGDAGLKDRVNQHYLSTFGAAAAVGLVSGLGQFVGTSGLGQADGNRTIVIAGGTTDAAAQATAQMMNRYLNRMPTITIREGHRLKIYLTSDLELPAYAVARAPNRSDGGLP